MNLAPLVPNNINKGEGYMETREPGSAAGDACRRQQSIRPQPRHTCGGCANIWTGLAVAHCAACHATFSSVGAFDRHRSLRGPHGSCLHPAEVPDLEFRAGIWRRRAMSAADVARRRR